MKLLVICFEYSGTFCIPTACLDLYSIIPIIKKCGIENLLLITDIINCYDFGESIGKLYEIYRNKEYCKILRRIIEKHCFHIPKEKSLSETYENSFIKEIRNITDTEIMLFYSGHIEKNSIILPTGEYVEIDKVRNSLCAKKIVSIIDSCHAERFLINRPEVINFFSCLDGEITINHRKYDTFTSLLSKKISSVFPVISNDLLDGIDVRKIISSNIKKITFGYENEPKN